MILDKRDGFRSAFGNWSIKSVAGFGPAEVEALLNDTIIIRNRQKIEASPTRSEELQSILSLWAAIWP